MRDETILTLVRHGETAANSERVWHGSTDTPLTERGQAQAKRVGEYLGDTLGAAAAVYSSQLQRARHTAGAIAAALAVTSRVDEDLAEYHLGSWEGKTYRELYRSEAFFERIARDPDFAPPGAESPRQVATRVAEALRRIATAHSGDRVVLVTHGVALTLGLDWLLDRKLCTFAHVMDNCAVSELVLEPEPRLLRFNDSAHLEGLRTRTPGTSRPEAGES